MTYNQDSAVRLQAVFSDVSGRLADPTTVQCKVKAPDGTVSSYTWAGGQIQRDSLGNFYYDLTLAASGSWAYRWKGTGAVVAVGESSLSVNAPGWS